jgi:hypothetical protein
MRRLGKTGAVAGLILLVAALALSGLAAGGGRKGGKTIVLTGGPPTQEEIDVGEPGPSPGDILVGRADLFKKGKKAGFARFTCIFNVGTGVQCTNHAHLFGRGQIVSQQSGDPTKGPIVIEPITGGTGEFRNARGQVRVDFSEGLRLTFRVIG